MAALAGSCLTRVSAAPGTGPALVHVALKDAFLQVAICCAGRKRSSSAHCLLLPAVLVQDLLHLLAAASTQQLEQGSLAGPSSNLSRAERQLLSWSAILGQVSARLPCHLGLRHP